MIVGIGVDVVDLARFERAVGRTPRLRERLFAQSERDLPLRSLAARFAAKEALMKALGSAEGLVWNDIAVVAGDGGAPTFSLSGSTERAVADRGIDVLHLSMTHDAGIAVAYVVAEARTRS